MSSVATSPLIEVVVTNSRYDVYQALGLVKRLNCRRCGWCCLNARVNDWEIAPIAKYTGLTRHKVKSMLSDGKLDNPCQFLKDGCSIYPVRPIVCRTYPIINHEGKMAIELCDAGRDLLKWL